MPGSSNDNEILNSALAKLRSDDVLVQNEGVAAVIHIGMAAIPAVLPLLESDMSEQRAQAMYALAQRHGFYPGQGFPTPEAEEQARAEWKDNGGYDYSADAATRAASVAKWQRWLETAEK